MSSCKQTVISTILSPIERVRVNVAVGTTYTPLHRDSIDEIIQDIRTQRTDAVLLSVGQYDPSNTARVAAVVREFPQIPAYGLITDDQKHNPHSVLSLGKAGIRTLIDARSPSGWETLRELLFRDQDSDLQRMAWQMITTDLLYAPQDCRRFFELLLLYHPYISAVQQLARLIHVLPSTLLSRFYRMKLPSPKLYIDVVRLIRAAALLENPGLSISMVAERLGYSSPQAFSRHTRCVLGIPPGQFRRRYTGESMLQFFRERLILPYIMTLNTFHPITAKPSWIQTTSLP